MKFGDEYNAAADLLDRNAGAERAGHTAFIDNAGAYSYQDLRDRCHRFAHVLGDLGVELEQRVALCLTDTIDLPTCFLGAITAGVVPIPISTRLTAADYLYILADSRARALVISAALYPQIAPHLPALPALRHVIISGPPDQALPAGADQHPHLDALMAAHSGPAEVAPTRRDDACFWLYTSGTTGRPKGVIHAHSHLVATAELYAGPTLGLSGDDVVFSAAKLFFAYGLGNALTFPMSVGATAVLLEGPPTPAAVSEILRRHRPTVFYGVPTLFGMLLANEELLPSREQLSLRICTSAGEALPPALLERWRARTGVDVLDGLGSTEGLHIFITNRVGEIRPGSSGRVVPGYDARLVDDDGEPVATGELGHLEVAGPSTALMYWNRRETSQETFRGRWMRTGDRYRQDSDGYYYYGGRADDMLKVGGIWVSPFEVESALLEHPSVLACAVVGARDDDQLIKPKAFVVLSPDQGSLDDGRGEDLAKDLANELIEFARERLASYKRPRWVEFCTELPTTATGKIQRYKLRG